MPIKLSKPKAPAEPVQVSVVESITDTNAADVLLSVQKRAQELAARDQLRGADMEVLVEETGKAIKTLEEDNAETRQKLDQMAELVAAGARTLQGGREQVDGSLVSWRAGVPDDGPRMDRDYYTFIAFSARQLIRRSLLGSFDRTSRDPEDYISTLLHRNAPLERAMARLQWLNDALLILHQHQAGSPSYEGMRSLRLFDLWRKEVKDFQRAAALSTTGVGTGAEWLPTVLSSRLHELVRITQRVPGYIAWETMTDKVMEDPVLTSDFIMSLEAEAATDVEDTSLNSTLSHLATSKSTLIAIKGMVRTTLSREADEDLIVGATDRILSLFALAINRGLENAIINGQKTSDIDSPAYGAKDFRKAWDGYRYWRNSMGNAVDGAGGAPTLEMYLNVLGKLGAYGMDRATLLWVPSIPAYVRMLAVKDTSGAALVLRGDTTPGASVGGTGQLGSLLGSPIAPSEFVPTDELASGLRDPAGNLTEILACSVGPESIRAGVRSGQDIRRGDEILMASDRIMLVGRWRGDFKPIRTPDAATAPICSGIVNIPKF